MRPQPPEEGGAPRFAGAGDPENVVVLHLRKDPNGASSAAQEKIAHALANDPWAAVRDRQRAVCVLHRLHFGLPVPADDARKMTAAYQQRRRQVAQLWQVYQ